MWLELLAEPAHTSAYRQSTNKIVGITHTTAALLEQFFRLNAGLTTLDDPLTIP